MFDNFFEGGSVLAVIFMVYAQSVMMEVLRFKNKDGLGFNGPRIFYSRFGFVAPLLAMPCALWPSIYIGLFDGLWSGFVAWLALQLVSVVMTQVLMIRSNFIGFHLIIASILMGLGYTLSLLIYPAW